MQNAITTNSVPHEIELKIKTAIELKKELEKYEKEIKESLMTAMLQNGITSIKNDKYTVTIANRSSYSLLSDEMPEAFVKTVLDTTKISLHEKLYGTVPEGVSKKQLTYLTWRAK